MRKRTGKGATRLRRWGQRVPLQWRLALASFALLAVLLAALGMVVSFAAQRALLLNEATSLQSQAFVAIKGTRGAITAQNAQLVDHLADGDTAAAVLAPDGAVEATSDDLQLPIPPPPVVPVTASAIQHALQSPPRSTDYLLARDSTGTSELVVLVPLSVTPRGSPVAVLELNTPTRHVDRAVQLIRLILAVGIAGALLLAALLMLPLVSTALRPLVAMERASRRIAAGELHLRLNEPLADDEIGRLARSFNTMVAQLEAAFQRQQQFVSDASHELRTPLTALGGGMEMLLLGADQGDIEAQRRLLRGMYREVERMRRLVEDLLTLTRLDEGRANLRIGRVDAAAAIRDVCEQAERLSSGQDIVCAAPEGLPAVRADSDRLRQVLLNLMDNALKYTLPPGRVALSGAVVDGGAAVELTVSDEGAGIAREALAHVFDRFYRADTARVRTGARTSGSGLGLSIVKGLVEAQGGAVHIDSEPDRGTTVAVRLPVWREQPATRAPSTISTTAASSAASAPGASASAPAEPVSSDT